MKTWRVVLCDRAMMRSKRGRKGKSCAIYVRASTREGAIKCAFRNRFDKAYAFFVVAREATPRELGCVTLEEAAAITQNMREAYRRKYEQQPTT